MMYTFRTEKQEIDLLPDLDSFADQFIFSNLDALWNFT